MDRGNVLSGAAFKAVFLSAIVVLAMLVVTGILSFIYIQRIVITELEEQITEEMILFKEVYDEQGKDGLIETINQIQAPLPVRRGAYGVFGFDGEALAGNIRVAPDFAGWGQTALAIDNRGPRPEFTASSAGLVEFYANSTKLDDVTIVVGRNLDLLRAVERAMLKTLALLGFILVLTMLAAGYFGSRQSLKKLQALESTLARVSQGNIRARVAVSPNNDQIDRISAQVNVHLDRLDSLMVSTKATAAAVAHDLKTPLSRAFLGLETALSRIDAGNDPRAALEVTQDELARLNRIFDTILRIQRIEADSERVRFRRIDLGPILDDLAETYAVVAEERGQTLTLDRDPALACEVEADEQMLRQMVVNLLQNAVLHCPAGTQISLAIKTIDGHVRLVVADDGPGIPVGERAQVFDPFYRTDASRTTEGSGLGLSLVKSIAERHRARITLSDNAPGLRVTVDFA